MKIFFIIALMILNSCSGFNIMEFSQKVKFTTLQREHFFDSELALRKTPIGVKSVDDVRIVRVEEMADLLSSSVNLSSELEDRTIVHYVKFSTDEPFLVDEGAIKQLAKDKDCDVVLYVEAYNVLNYNLQIHQGGNQTMKIKERDGYHFYTAFFYSKVKLDRSYSIDLDK